MTLNELATLLNENGHNAKMWNDSRIYLNGLARRDAKVWIECAEGGAFTVNAFVESHPTQPMAWVLSQKKELVERGKDYLNELYLDDNYEKKAEVVVL